MPRAIAVNFRSVVIVRSLEGEYVVAKNGRDERPEDVKRADSDVSWRKQAVGMYAV
jgi:hypothetical protein